MTRVEEVRPTVDGAAFAPGVTPTSVAMLHDWKRQLAGITAGLRDDAQRIDALRAMEELKSALGGEQAAVTVDFAVSQRREQAKAGALARHQGRGVAAQVALARRESGHRGQKHLRLAGRLATDLPYTFAALRAGRISEFKASIVARETECLSPEDRERVDVCLAGDPAWIEGMGDRELESEARKLAYRFDPQTFVKRNERAETDRHVTSRPAPDGMSYVTALLPLVPGVAVHATLKKYADAQQAAGDPRGRGQLMADRLVELVTGQAHAGDVPVSVGLVLSDDTLLGADEESARVRGYGPIPAEVARRLIKDAHAKGLAALRRLYTRPGSGQVVGMDSRSRLFPAGLADLIGIRDADTCRMNWCDAPIRPTDHAKGAAEGGETSFENGQGLCEAHNIAKEAQGWSARPRPGPDGRHTIITTTPTGHRYTSVAPEIRIIRRPAIEIYLTGDYHQAS